MSKYLADQSIVEKPLHILDDISNSRFRGNLFDVREEIPCPSVRQADLRYTASGRTIEVISERKSKIILIRNLLHGILIMIGMLVATIVHAQSEKEESELAKINRELENPLAKRWSLVFQENFSINQGNLVDDNISSNTFFFQPALPIPFGNNMVFTARPVFPLVTAPDFQSDISGSSKTTGFGDIQMATLLGPGNASGWVWGAGATFVFPTATSENLGNGKYQAGPAVMIFLLSKTWTKGIFIQHWWSYAGSDTRSDISRTDFQYIFRRNFGTWSLGLGPTITINWNAEPDNRLTFPVGLGYTRTVRIGKTPVKMRFEPQYSIFRPDDYGNVWNIRFQFAPVIKSPFMDS